MADNPPEYINDRVVDSVDDRDGTRVEATKIIVLLLLVGSVFLFYFFTLAPTLLWGDSAYFQRSAFERILRPDAGGHWLWFQFAQLFVGLGWGEVAFRVNLLSAVAATVTILFLYQAMLALGLNWKSASFASICFAVSHTFWMHAVRAEVYTVFTAVMALQLWLWFSWRPRRAWPIYAAGVLAGVAVLGHQMALLLGPAALYLLWRRRAWLSRRQWVQFWLSLAVGLIFFLVIAIGQTRTPNPFDGLWAYFTRFDGDFSGAMFDFSFARLPRDAAIWIGLWGLQFIGVAGLLAIYGLTGHTLRSVSWQCLLILYVTCVFFAFSYRVNDQFAFYLPSYVAVTFFVANGFQKLQRIAFFASYKIGSALLLLCILVPMATYAIVPRVLSARGMNPLGVRILPGRDPNDYFLWPGSGDYWGAHDFAQGALENLPPNSTIVADYTPYETLFLLRNVEGVRRDVQIMRVEQNIPLTPLAEELLPGGALFLADDDPRYYDIASLADYCLVPFSNVYQVLEAQPSSACP